MPATPDELFAMLAGLGIETRTHRHPPVFTVEENRALRGGLSGGHCKSLFLKNKKDQLWLVVCREDRRMDFRRLERQLGSGRLSFGKPELLMDVLGVTPGSVTPFGLINDRGGRARVVLDKAMLIESPLNYHPLENTATTQIAAADLLRFIRGTGHEPLILDLDAPMEDAG